MLFLVMGFTETLLFLPRSASDFLAGHWFIFWGPFLLLPPLGFAVGWIASFPRWSYPYLVLSVLTALYMTNVATPGLRILGYTFGRNDLWGGRAFIPLIVASLAAACTVRSIAPWENFGRQLREDWTLGCFGMFGMMPLLLGMMFDETRTFAIPFMIALSIILSLTAAAYLRLRRPRERALILLAGSTMTIITGFTAAAWYDYVNSGHSPNVIALSIASAVLLGVIFFPAGVSYVARRVHLPIAMRG
jgi:hypothetical protein